MRAALLILALLSLSACNIVVTKAPLYTAADEAGAPAMKPGVWAFEDRDCAFDEKKPLTEWPDCAGGGVIAPGMLSGHDKKDGQDKWDHLPFVLAAGSPRIAQVMFKTMAERAPPGSPAAAKEMPYGYAAIRPGPLSGDGAITSISYWLVLCGPPAPPSRDPKHPNFGTIHPLPGMVMKRGDPVCTTTSRTALAAAAKASEAWADKVMHAHWVRAAGPGDGPPTT